MLEMSISPSVILLLRASWMRIMSLAPFFTIFFAYDVIHDYVESTYHVSMTCLEGKSNMCLTALIRSLCVLCAKFLEHDFFAF